MPTSKQKDTTTDTATEDTTAILADESATDEDAQGSTVDVSTTDQKAKDYPEPQSAKGAFVNDAGIDLNESADHGPRAVGNRYGVSADAAKNFRDEADAEIKRLERRIEELKAERDRWNEQIDSKAKDED